jgi:hypothetical protein
VSSLEVPMQLEPLELVFSSSRIVIDDVQTPDGGTGKKLIILHPCGIAAVALLPEEAAKQIGAQLMGSGKIVVAREAPGPPTG